VLHELHEHTIGAVGVEERDQVSTGSRARLLVDEAEPVGSKSLEVGREVLAPVGDVMEAGTSTGDEAADRSVGGERLEKLEGPRERDADALGFEGLWAGTPAAGNEFEEATGLIKRTNGDRHVIERALA